MQVNDFSVRKKQNRIMVFILPGRAYRCFPFVILFRQLL